MKRAALSCLVVMLGVALNSSPAWARGFGESRGGGGGGGGGFSHGPSPSRPTGEYRAPASVPHPTYHSAPVYHPGPTAHYESHVETYHPAYNARSNAPLHQSFDSRPDGIRQSAGDRNVRVNSAHVNSARAIVNNHWDHWHGHNWDNGWYHGNWHGHWDNYWHAGWSDWWANPWYARPAFWGVTGWWLGASVYNWGYVPYYNPYYTQSYQFGPTLIDYEQPVQVVDYGAQAADGATEPQAPPEATQEGDAARQAFYDGNYSQARHEVERALARMPGDPALHELRALILFAMGEYRAAAAAVHSLLAVGPGWDWTTMIGLYPNADIYTKQLRALEVFRQSHPSDAAARFLLAYHYLSMGHTAAAATELRAVVELVPQDRVASQLLSMITSPRSQGGQAGQPNAAPPAGSEDQSPPAEPTGPPLDPATLVGNWTAHREDGSTIQLRMTPDSKFTWRFSQGAKSREFIGTSTVANNLLVLQQANGESMVGRVVPSGGRGFRFFLVGGPPDDPGLTFTP